MGRVAAHQHTPRLERLASSPAGAGRFVAGTVARMQNATALFMNVVEKKNSRKFAVARSRSPSAPYGDWGGAVRCFGYICTHAGRIRGKELLPADTGCCVRSS